MANIFSNLLTGAKKPAAAQTETAQTPEAQVPDAQAFEAEFADSATAQTFPAAPNDQTSNEQAAGETIEAASAAASAAASDSGPENSTGAPEAEELEEWSEPLVEAPPLAPLPPGAMLPLPQGGALLIVELLDTRPQSNTYRAALMPDNSTESDAAPSSSQSGAADEVSGLPVETASPTSQAADVFASSPEPTPEPPVEPATEAMEPPPATIRLRQASGESAARLAREAQMCADVNTPLVPRTVAFFDDSGKTYLAQAAPAQSVPAQSVPAQSVPAQSVPAQTLATLLEGAAALPEVLHVLAQVAAALMHMHAAGWAHLGVRPLTVALGKPVQLTDFSFVARLGEAPPAPISHAGYSAPELIARTPVDARADIYALGALLYHAVNGAPIPESGADLETWQPPQAVAGAPQILRRCLGAPDTRYASVEELHRDLMRLKNHLKPDVRYGIAAASTIGLEATRSTNQDAFGCLSGALQSESGAASWAVVCVADGMGGMAAGEVASEVAVQEVLAQAAASCAVSGAASGQTSLPSAAEQSQRIKQWVASANEKVCAALEARGARGGCTLACAFLLERRLAIAHAGDCRIYRLRGDEWKLLSRDHSFVMALVLQNEIGMDEVRTHPDRNKVTRSLGDRHPLPPYFVDTLETVTGSATIELETGDVLLLCSDGLWEPVLEEDMTRALQTCAPDLHAAAHQMLNVALQRGAPDNATVALLRVDEAPAVAAKTTEAGAQQAATIE